MNMLKPQRKSKRAGLISILSVMLLLIPCFTTACQPTPESSVVQNKSDDDLQNAIEQTAGSQMSVIDAHVTGTYSNSSDTVTVNIDADVTTPNMSKIPVAQVEETTISADQIEQIVKAFYGDAKLYKVVSTKADIQATILRMQQKLNDDEALLNSDLAEASGSTDLEELRRLQNERIEEQKALLQDAPEERPEINGYDAALSGGAGLAACVDIGEDYMGYVSASVSDFFGQSINLYAFGGEWPHQYRILNYSHATKIEMDNDDDEFQNAKRMAENMIKEMGMDGVTLGEAYLSEDYATVGEVSSGRKFYVFCFERVIGEGSVDFNFISSMCSDSKTEEYDRVLPNETIQIWIEGDTFRQFTWRMPMKVTEIVNDNVALAIDYEKAIELMKQQAFVQFVNTYNYYSDVRVDITSITLEFVRIKEIDTGNYLVVPAWVSHGQVTAAVTQEYIDADPYAKDLEVGQYVSADVFYLGADDTILTINALDGSVINITTGY